MASCAAVKQEFARPLGVNALGATVAGDNTVSAAGTAVIRGAGMFELPGFANARGCGASITPRSQALSTHIENSTAKCKGAVAQGADVRLEIGAMGDR